MIDNYVIILINQMNYVSDHKHTLSDEDISSATHRIFVDVIPIYSYQYYYSI